MSFLTVIIEINLHLSLTTITVFYIFPQQIAYVFFLCLYTYTVLVKLPKQPAWMEWYVVAYISTLILEKLREIISAEPVELK